MEYTSLYQIQNLASVVEDNIYVYLSRISIEVVIGLLLHIIGEGLLMNTPSDS